MKHLLIVRTSGSFIDINTYNCQELGLAKALTAKKVKVSLVLAGPEYKKESVATEGEQVDVYYLKTKGLNQQLSVFYGLAELIRKLNPSCIQVHDLGLFMTWKTVRIAKSLHIPVVLIQGNYRETQKPILKQFEQLYNCSFGRYVIKKVNRIGCKTKMAAHYVRGIYDCNLQITNIGLDVSRFQGAPDKDWSSALSSKDKHVLLYVGTLEGRRNPHFLLDILQVLPADYVLALAGNGPLVDELKVRVEDSELKGRCMFLGKLSQTDLPSLYKCADLFLLASNYEIYGMVLLESMYFGVPVVSTLTAGSDTIIESNKDGLIIQRLDANKWAKEIVSICSDSSRLKSLSNAAQNKIMSQFMWNEVADTYLTLYGF
jgi:glycosyltransferase involved in cell wall biosynthesis